MLSRQLTGLLTGFLKYANTVALSVRKISPKCKDDVYSACSKAEQQKHSCECQGNRGREYPVTPTLYFLSRLPMGF